MNTMKRVWPTTIPVIGLLWLIFHTPWRSSRVAVNVAFPVQSHIHWAPLWEPPAGHAEGVWSASVDLPCLAIVAAVIVAVTVLALAVQKAPYNRPV